MTPKTVAFYLPDGAIRSIFAGDEVSLAAHAERVALPFVAVSAAPIDYLAAVLAEHFVDLSGADPVLADCRSIEATWDPESGVFEGLPIPCVVRILGQAHQVEDGVADLSDLAAGDYQLEVRATGFLPQIYTVTR